MCFCLGRLSHVSVVEREGEERSWLKSLSDPVWSQLSSVGLTTSDRVERFDGGSVWPGQGFPARRGWCTLLEQCQDLWDVSPEGPGEVPSPPGEEFPVTEPR